MSQPSPPRLTRIELRDYCAAAAVHLLREREARYPALVNAAKLTAAAAAESLELARCVVAQWRWVIDPAMPPLPDAGERGHFGAYNFEMAAEMAAAAGRSRAISLRDPANKDAAELADLYEALAWHQADRCATARIVWAVEAERELTIRARTEAHQRLAAAQRRAA